MESYRSRISRLRAPSNAVTALGAFALLSLSGCSPQAHTSIDLDPGDVTKVELYFYEFPHDEPVISRTTVVDRGLVAELVHAFTDMPVQSLGNLSDRLPGSRATGVRFLLADGEQVDLTQVFVSPHNVAIFWPDGSVERTAWGVPLVDYYEDAGASEQVTHSHAPEAPLPKAPESFSRGRTSIGVS